MPSTAYATGDFIDTLSKFLLSETQRRLGSRLDSPAVLPSETVAHAAYKLEKAINVVAEQLRQLAADRLAASVSMRNSLSAPVLMGASPKRRASEEDLRLNRCVVFSLSRSKPSSRCVITRL